MSTGVDLENYIHSLIELTLLYDDILTRLDELIDYWEEQCWSTHVPNDGVNTVIDYVTQLCYMYRQEIGYLLPPSYKDRYSEHTHMVNVDTQLYHTTITIRFIGEK